MTPARGVLRVIDANINRAREGLRVCEDLLRFAFASARHFRRIRGIRYALNARVRQLPVDAAVLARARDAARDAGRRSRAGSVTSAEHLLLVNLQRTKEALRSLEESCRLVAPAQAGGFQEIRFDVYDLERDILLGLAAVRHHRRGRGRRP